MSPRLAVRAVLRDPTGSVFLMRMVDPGSAQGRWITPGGAVNDGESYPGALRREVKEELGVELSLSAVGPAIWQRELTFSWAGGKIHQHETFYLVKTDRFVSVRCGDGDEGGPYWQGEPRWWTIAELRGSDDDIALAGLADLLHELDMNGIPSAPANITGHAT